MKTIGYIEKIILIRNNKRIELKAKIDTGAISTSIDENVFKKLGIFKILGERKIRSASLKEHKRLLVPAVFFLAGVKIETKANLCNREYMHYPVIIGRKDICYNFLVDVSKKYTHEPGTGKKRKQ